MSSRRRVFGLLALAALITAIPAVALAQSDTDEGGVLVRVAGDAALGADEVTAVAVVVEGDLEVQGDVRVVVVTNGTATLSGATVDTLVVVNGAADLRDGTVVTGDVWAPESDITDDGSAEIGGEIRTDVGGLFVGLWVFGLLFALGLGILGLVSAVTFAAVAPATAREASRAIRDEVGNVLVAGLLFWILVPLAAIGLLITVVGAPLAFAVWAVLLPLVGFIGYLVTAVWIGELIVDRGGTGHPYAASIVGILVLMAAGLVPVVGPLLGIVVTLLGGGSLVLLAWRRFRPGQPAPTHAVASET